ncbi:hypothetical protein GCM10027563_17830 [Parasphingorhabdus pacifica]
MPKLSERGGTAQAVLSLRHIRLGWRIGTSAAFEPLIAAARGRINLDGAANRYDICLCTIVGANAAIAQTQP